jgi:hypothetical protein
MPETVRSMEGLGLADLMLTSFAPRQTNLPCACFDEL